MISSRERLLLIFLLSTGLSACSTANRIRSTDRCYTVFRTPGLRAECVQAVMATRIVPEEPEQKPDQGFTDGPRPLDGRPENGPGLSLPADGPGMVVPGCENPQPCRQALADRALALHKKPRWHAKGQKFLRDCVGFVSTVLVSEGFPLKKYRPRAIPGQGGGGVRLLWRMAQRYHMLHTRPRPKVGDIIFWDNTTDRNKNGRLDDPLTHVGLVADVDPDGTITYIHKGNSGVKSRKMNLLRPSVRRDPKTKKLINSYLRRRGYAGDQKRLAGEIFRAFATVYGAPLNSS